MLSNHIFSQKLLVMTKFFTNFQNVIVYYAKCLTT